MHPATSALGPDFETLRPMHLSATSPSFPVYHGLTERLLAATDPDDAVRHVDPDQVRYNLTPESGDEGYWVHAGYYRNVRATRFAVIEVLERAMRGESIFPDGDRDELEGAVTIAPMEALYVTGHSLGGAMASMLTVMLRAKRIYAPLASKLKATYTYGQPMIGNEAFAKACDEATFEGTSTPLNSALFRYVYADVLAPQLPPHGAGSFGHFGQELRCERIDKNDPRRPAWELQETNTCQTGALNIAFGTLALFTREYRRLRRLPLQQSIVDQGPNNYIAALTPPGVRSEFGD